RLVSRARAAGLSISVRDVFAHQSVAELAAVATPLAAATAGAAGGGTGVVEPTPIMRWLGGLGAGFEHFHQSMLLALPAGLEAGGDSPGRVGIVVHHLAMDGVSWRILVPDLIAAVSSAAGGRPPSLEPVGTSFRAWSSPLAAEAAGEGRLGELELWRGMLAGGDPLLGSRGLDRGVDT